MHSRCPDNHVCDHYEKACLPKCESDQDCHQGLKCFSDGSCLKPCMADPECDGASEHCSPQLGACVPNCQNDNDCNQHQICVLNKCYETCATNRPNACPASHTCRSAQQVTKLLAFKKFFLSLRIDSGFKLHSGNLNILSCLHFHLFCCCEHEL